MPNVIATPQTREFIKILVAYAAAIKPLAAVGKFRGKHPGQESAELAARQLEADMDQLLQTWNEDTEFDEVPQVLHRCESSWRSGCEVFTVSVDSHGWCAPCAADEAKLAAKEAEYHAWVAEQEAAGWPR